jgi:hypothetical protein
VPQFRALFSVYYVSRTTHDVLIAQLGTLLQEKYLAALLNHEGAPSKLCLAGVSRGSFIKESICSKIDRWPA